MKELKYFPQFAFSCMLAIALLFSGCDSTGSDGNEDDDSSSAFFNSEEIAPGETYSYTFEDEETVDYYCEIHAPNMQGQVTVTSSEDPSERDTVSMENNQFIPQDLTIAPNTEVIWINNDSHDHDIRTGNPSSDDGDDGGY